jgi:hypothetical protein
LFFLREKKYKKKKETAKDIRIVIKNASVIEDVYPKYSFIKFRLEAWSGFNEQRVHL